MERDFMVALLETKVECRTCKRDLEGDFVIFVPDQLIGHFACPAHSTNEQKRTKSRVLLPSGFLNHPERFSGLHVASKWKLYGLIESCWDDAEKVEQTESFLQKYRLKLDSDFGARLLFLIFDSYTELFRMASLLIDFCQDPPWRFVSWLRVVEFFPKFPFPDKRNVRQKLMGNVLTEILCSFTNAECCLQLLRAWKGKLENKARLGIEAKARILDHLRKKITVNRHLRSEIQRVLSETETLGLDQITLARQIDPNRATLREIAPFVGRDRLSHKERVLLSELDWDAVEEPLV
jgi:hypothetical protein